METNEEKQIKLSEHIKQIAQLIFDNEIRREESLIQQSSHMQTAFSFFSAALFMVATIAVEHKYPLSYAFLLWAFSSITVCLLVSLILATLAQTRFQRQDFSTIKKTKEYIIKTYETIESEASKNLQYTELIETLQADLYNINESRVKLIRWSMRIFYFAIGISVFWFCAAICLMWGNIS